MPRFQQIGTRMVLFGLYEPKLYRLLFMQERRSARSFDGLLKRLGAEAENSLQAICGDYGLERGEAKALFETVWIYTFGVGALCAAGVCRFSEKEIDRMLTSEFQTVMALIKSGKKQSGGNG